MRASGDPLGVAVAQFAPGGDKAANLEAMRGMIETAVARGAGLVVFPEYSMHFLAPLGSQTLDAAESIDGEFVQALGALAVQYGIHLVAGIVETADGPRVHNTLVALSPTGDVVARYRKLHLYDAYGVTESEWMQHDTVAAPETFDVAGFTVGLQTCYDIRFPEVTRWLVDAGVNLVLVPAEWVPGPTKERHWNALLAVRAIENTVFVAAADHTAPGGVGLSQVLDPTGTALATLGSEEGVTVAFVDPSHLDEARRINPALALRRFAVVPR
ncbi:carbon-nitrogen hydrolase family protein [Subtercola boreus]|uniref:Hydrolase n=1 Tax=Subtercola boreus TaxID=120213 RepID=A0A3E0WA82_9MICO|nr:carbon-nitrogen hydrolase family protein [Subtercola boreus]RFA20373.1 hydrolase [Subtercola boreus]RFA20526.1 hydrolase [Subtercola boreus]RFA26777.1 hydrolase [Subtercola boreus]